MTSALHSVPIAWEPSGAEPTVTLRLAPIAADDALDLGGRRARQALSAAATERCRHAGTALLAAVLMVKNEAQRVVATLTSARSVCDKLIVLDTGSTDGTMDVIRRFCAEHQWPLKLADAPFVDFASSRNQLLQLADGEAEFLLLLDANDTLENGDFVRALCAQHALLNVGLAGDVPSHATFLNKQATSADAFWNDPNDASQGIRVPVETWRNVQHLVPCHYLIDVETRSANDTTTTDRDSIPRLIRARSGWRYSGPVHEVLCNDRWRVAQLVRIDPTQFKIVRHAVVDANRNEQRRALHLSLINRFLSKPGNEQHPRALYYKATTLRDMGRLDDAISAFEARCNCSSDGARREETFNAHVGLVRTVVQRGLTEQMHAVVEHVCWRAFGIEARVEPLLFLHRLYDARREFYHALMVTSLAVRLPYPVQAAGGVDRSAYVDERHARYALALTRFKMPEEACQIVDRAMQRAKTANESTPQCAALRGQIETAFKDTPERAASFLEPLRVAMPVRVPMPPNSPKQQASSQQQQAGASSSAKQTSTVAKKATSLGSIINQKISEQVTAQRKQQQRQQQRQQGLRAPATAVAVAKSNTGVLLPDLFAFEPTKSSAPTTQRSAVIPVLTPVNTDEATL